MFVSGAFARLILKTLLNVCGPDCFFFFLNCKQVRVGSESWD